MVSLRGVLTLVGVAAVAFTTAYVGGRAVRPAVAPASAQRTPATVAERVRIVAPAPPDSGLPPLAEPHRRRVRGARTTPRGAAGAGHDRPLPQLVAPQPSTTPEPTSPQVTPIPAPVPQPQPRPSPEPPDRSNGGNWSSGN